MGPGAWPRSRLPALDHRLADRSKSQRVNLLDDPGPAVKDAAIKGVLPTIYVSTVPAELVQTEGRPDYEPIDGTDLLYVRTRRRTSCSTPRTSGITSSCPGGGSGASPWPTGRGSTWRTTSCPPISRRSPRRIPRGRSGLRRGDASGPGGSDRQQHPPDRRGEPRGHEVPGHLRRGAEVPGHRGHDASARGEYRGPRHPGRREDLLRAERRRVVRGCRAHGAVGGGHQCSGGHLHDPGQLAAALRHLCPGLRLEPPDRVRGLHPGVLRDGRRPELGGRLRNRLRVPAGLRRHVLVSAARDLRVRRPASDGAP